MVAPVSAEQNLLTRDPGNDSRYQQSENLSRYAGALAGPGNDRTSPPGMDSAQAYLPGVAFQAAEVQRQAIIIHGKNGHSDTVTGVTPEKGENATQFLHRLHPDLSPDQLQKEVAHLVRYNRNYGNNITAESTLDPSKPVYLASIETKDSSGHVTKIESPTGRITEIAYDGAGSVAGYQIIEPNGCISEQVSKGSNGAYSLVRQDGERTSLATVAIDQNGDITATDEQGDKVGHLTRGDDVYTQFQNDKPACATVVREGQIISAYQYNYSDNKSSIYVTYADDPTRRVLLNPDDNGGSLSRLKEGRGDLTGNTDSGNVADVLPGQFGTQLLQKLGLPVTNANLAFLAAWQKAEGGSPDNPFNTTQDAPGATNFNSVGVKRYPSVAEGLDATAKTLTNGYYGGILDAMKQGNDPMVAARALAASPWGTGALVEQVLSA